MDTDRGNAPMHGHDCNNDEDVVFLGPSKRHHRSTSGEGVSPDEKDSHAKKLRRLDDHDEFCSSRIVLDWFLLTSSNLSQAAWGVTQVSHVCEVICICVIVRFELYCCFIFS